LWFAEINGAMPILRTNHGHIGAFHEFVDPSDLSMGVISLANQIPVDYSINDISEQIFDAVGRFAYLGFAEKDEDGLFRIVSMPGFLTDSRKVYVFEIPDPLQTYAIGILLAQGFGHENFTRIARPILVPLVYGQPDQELYLSRLTVIFDPDKSTPDTVQIPNLVPDDDRLGPAEKVRIGVYSISGDSGLIDILINSFVIANDPGLNWNLLKWKESRSVRCHRPSFSLEQCLIQFQQPELLVQI
jgi:hypothetical protein